MSVIIVLAYVMTRTQYFNDILQKKTNYRHHIVLILVFGLFSIYGTLSGEKVLGVMINIRDLGPAIAGLIGGPLVGTGGRFDRRSAPLHSGGYHLPGLFNFDCYSRRWQEGLYITAARVNLLASGEPQFLAS